MFEKDKVSSLRICPNSKRQGHAENNSQFIYSLNGEKYFVNPEAAYGGPNRQLFINAPRKWDIVIEIGKLNECEEKNF